MYNCLILGSGRSGTSMVAGTLAGAGYFMGERLYQPRPSNPKGFFEDVEINAINEAILAPWTPWTPPAFRPRRLYRWLRRAFFAGKPGDGQRWLARLPLNAALAVSPAISARIRAQTARTPFCFKDPRFCYTLPVWRPFLRGTRFVCVFRDPTVTASSMVKELQASPQLACLRLPYADCLEVWRLMYRHVLEWRREQEEWIFLHYDQMLDGAGLTRLAQFLEVQPDRNFPEHALRRTQPAGQAPDAVRTVYEQLCHLAGME